jgi:hypothetical protein
MRRIAAMILGAGLSLAAGQALACPYPHHRHGEGASYDRPEESFRHEDRRYEDERYQASAYDEERYDGREYDARYEDAYDAPQPPPLIGASAWYMDGRHPKPPCDCEPAGGAVQLSDSFFYDTGGVGPIPDGGWYTGGGFYAVGDSFASARSFAGASSSASVHIRGGRHFGGHHKGGHKGGHSKGGKKGGKG